VYFLKFFLKIKIIKIILQYLNKIIKIIIKIYYLNFYKINKNEKLYYLGAQIKRITIK